MSQMSKNARKIDRHTKHTYRHVFENISQERRKNREIWVRKKKMKTRADGWIIFLRNISYTICVYRFRLVEMCTSKHS